MFKLAKFCRNAHALARFIEWAAGSPEVADFHFPGIRVSALDHESGDAAVKSGAIVEPIFAELDEIGDVLGRDLRKKHDDDFPFGGLKHGDFIPFFWGDGVLIKGDPDEFLTS